MYRSRLLSIGILCLLSFVWISFKYDVQPISGIDESLIRHIQGIESAMLTNVMKVVSFIGSGTIVIMLAAVSLIYLIWTMQYRKAIIVAIAVSGSALLNHLLKALFERSRPNIHPIIGEVGYSFPSGHSMNAFTLYGVLTIVLWALVRGTFSRFALLSSSVFMILLIGVSRIYLGVHYPSDVIGAYLASCTWICLVIFVAQPKQSLH